MGRTACTEPQCLYKGALYLTSVPVQGWPLHYILFWERKHFLSLNIAPGPQIIIIFQDFIFGIWLINLLQVFFTPDFYLGGPSSSAVGWGTALQAGRSRVRFPYGVIGIFHWQNPSGRNMILGLTQTLTEISTRNISCGLKAAGAWDWQP